MMEDILVALRKMSKRIGTIDRGICEMAIAEVTRLRAVVVTQSEAIGRLSAERAHEIDDESTLAHFDRYVAGDRK